MYDMPEEIDVQADGALRIITLNRPEKRNALNNALRGQVLRALEEADRDDEVKLHTAPTRVDRASADSPLGQVGDAPP